MSGGEQQMCAIGRALMARPKLLMLDEPSMGLAPIFVERIFEIIHEINEQGTTILLVEQNALMALDAAHRGYVLETGHVVLDRRREEPPRRTSRYARPTSARPRASPPTRSGKYGGESRKPMRVGRPCGRAPSRARRRAARRDEAELPGRGGVPAAGDEHAPRRSSAGWQAAQSRNGRSGWHGAARAVRRRARGVGRPRPLGLPRARRVARRRARIAWKSAR